MNGGRTQREGVRNAFGVIVGAGAITITALCVLLMRPGLKNIADLREEIERHNQVLDLAQSAIGDLEAYEKTERKPIEKLSARARQQIPSEIRLPGLLSQLQTAALRAGVHGVRITTQHPQPVTRGEVAISDDREQARSRGLTSEQGCWKVPVVLTGKGKYRQVAAMLEMLGKCDRLFTVASVQVHSAQSEPRQLGFELLLEAYYLADIESENQ